MKNCRHKLILGKVLPGAVHPDGDERTEGLPVHHGDQIMVRYCIRCDRIVDAWVEGGEE